MTESTAAEFYSACKLTENPFRENPAVASSKRASIWVGYEKERRKLVRIIEQARADQIGSTRMFLLFGNFGTGKSHAFLWLQNIILHDQSEEFDSCVYYIRSLKTQGGKFSFFRAFQEYVVRQSRLLEDLNEFRSFLQTEVPLYKRNFDIPSKSDNTEVIKTIFQAPELVHLATTIYETSGSLEDVVTVKDDFDSIQRFSTLVNLFTFPIPDKEGNSVRYKKAVYLFIDELDDLQGTTAKEGRLVNDHIRHLYDYSQGCFCLGLGISAELSELSMYFLDYVLTRIDRTIELTQLDRDQALEFIRGIFKHARTEDVSDFFPFEQQAIEHIIDRMVQITPRAIIKSMFETIEHIRLQSFSPTEDNLVTLDKLDELGVLEDVLDEL